MVKTHGIIITLLWYKEKEKINCWEETRPPRGNPHNPDFHSTLQLFFHSTLYILSLLSCRVRVTLCHFCVPVFAGNKTFESFETLTQSQDWISDPGEVKQQRYPIHLTNTIENNYPYSQNKCSPHTVRVIIHTARIIILTARIDTYTHRLNKYPRCRNIRSHRLYNYLHTQIK